MIEIYAVKVPSMMNQSLFSVLLNKATPEKRERISYYAIEEDRIRSLFADLLMRSIIMKKTGLKNEEISIRTNAYGKPYLENRKDFHFNLSHSGIWVVAAVDSKPVGIDVEAIKEINLDIPYDFFSEDEHHELMNKRDKLSYFFTLWTIKESYVKIIGKGMSFPLHNVSCRFVSEDRIVLNSPDGKTINGVSFAQYNIHSDYKMFLCATHDGFPPQVKKRNIDSLIRDFLV